MNELDKVLARIRTLAENMGYVEEKINDVVIPAEPTIHKHNQSSCSLCKGALKGETQHYALGRLLHPIREH